MPSPPKISQDNLFQVHKCIPKSWRSPSYPTPTALETPSFRPTSGEQRNLRGSLVSCINSLSVQGHLYEAFATFALLRFHCPRPSLLLLRPLSSLLSCAASQTAFRQGLQLHGSVLSHGFQDHSTSLAKLIRFYLTFGLHPQASSVAENSVNNQCLSWNLLISTNIRFQFWKDAIFAYKCMVKRCISGDRYTYSSVLKACSMTCDLDLGREIHCCLVNDGLELDVHVWNALIAMYVKCRKIDFARRVFDIMNVKDVVAYNTMIWGYASEGMWKEAFELLQMLQVNLSVNTVTWNAIMVGSLHAGNYFEVLKLISRMRISGLVFDDATLVIGLHACWKVESLKSGKEMHGLAIRCNGFVPENVMNTLITMYCRCKNTNYAYMLFRISHTQNLPTWNAMLSGFAHVNEEEEACLLFQKMIGSGIRPDYLTVLTMLSLCLRSINLKHGQEIHCYLTKHGLEHHSFIENSLIGIYSKAGKMSVARRVFNLMIDHDVVSYTVLITGYRIQGKGITSLKLFNDMIINGIKPDRVTMVAILSACSHSGLITEGQMLFNYMIANCGIMPQVEHYSCMVDLYCRAGLLSKAEDMINRMPLQPSPAMLATLLIACRIRGHLEMGLRIARKLLGLNSDNPSHYSLISDMFASTGCWQELAIIRTLMRNLEARKTSNCLWLDIGNEICAFMAVDQSNKYAHDTLILLSGLVPYTSAGDTSSHELEEKRDHSWRQPRAMQRPGRSSRSSILSATQSKGYQSLSKDQFECTFCKAIQHYSCVLVGCHQQPHDCNMPGGNFIYLLAQPQEGACKRQAKSPLELEVGGMLEEIKRCATAGITHITIETDAQALRQLIYNKAKRPWKLLNLLKDIDMYLQSFVFLESQALLS